MILVKGTSVAFDLGPDKAIECPRAHGLMHDESGSAWPKSSVLVGPYKRTARAIDPGGRGRAYFGGDYQARAAAVALPPRDLGRWRKIGEVTCVWYVRPGTRAPGRFRHRFGAGWETFLLGSHKPVLYVCRSGGAEWHRLELGAGAVVDDRGFVSP